MAKSHSNSVNAVAFSPDGRLIVSGSHNKTVHVWDAATGAERQEPRVLQGLEKPSPEQRSKSDRGKGTEEGAVKPCNVA